MEQVFLNTDVLGCLRGTFSCNTDQDSPQPPLTGSCKTICIPAPNTTCTGIEEKLAPPFTEQGLKEDAFSVAGDLEILLNWLCTKKKNKKIITTTLALCDARWCHCQTSEHHRQGTPKGEMFRRLGHHSGQEITQFPIIYSSE